MKEVIVPLKLFEFGFTYKKKWWKSIFHCMCFDFSGTEDHSLEEAMDYYKGSHFEQEFFAKLFGIYAYQHYEKVKEILQQYDTDTIFYLGEVVPFKKVSILTEFTKQNE